MVIKKRKFCLLKKCCFIIIFILISIDSRGQQQISPDPTADFVKEIKTKEISNDGKWIVLETLLVDKKINILINTESNYEKVLDQSKSFFFSADSSMLYFIDESNQLVIYDLFKKEILKYYSLDAPSYKPSHNGNYLGFMANGSLYIVNKVGEILRIIPHAKDFDWNPTSERVVYISNQEKDNLYQLELYDIVQDSNNVISSFTFPLYLKSWDNIGKRLLFSDDNYERLYTYDDNQKKVLSLELEKIYPDYRILIHRVAYLNDLDKILITIQEKKKSSEDNFEIWNSTSKWIAPKMASDYENDTSIKTLIWAFKENKVQQIDTHHFSTIDVQSTTSLAFLYDKLQYEPQYLREVEADLYTVNLETLASHKIIDKQYISSNFISVSPTGRYIVYFKNHNWNILDRIEGSDVVITSDVSDIFFNDQSLSKIYDPYSKPIWTENESEVYLQSEFDIWVYTLRSKTFKKLTQGKKEGITYRIDPLDQVINKLKRLHSKFEGNIVKEKSPLLLKMSYSDYSSNYAMLENKILKELNLKSPQFFITNKINDTTILFVKEKFNYSPELWSYSFKNKTSKLLYKSNPYFADLKKLKYKVLQYQNQKNKFIKASLLYPKNYDATKKYPMIVWIYEKKSKEINNFIPLYDYNEDGFNILKYVENGYFVLLPDIEYEIGNPGNSALNYTELAVNHVIDLGIVDSKRIGLIGFSFGGYEAAFIATQSKLFKTTVVGSGITDLASWYHSYNNRLKNEQIWRLEGFQLRMGDSFYKIKDSYIKNSPTTYVENIETPLLIWTGKEDWNVNSNQSIYLFLAMKRLGKEVNLILYDKEEHGLIQKGNQKHLTHTIFRWFEHYLQ